MKRKSILEAAEHPPVYNTEASRKRMVESSFKRYARLAADESSEWISPALSGMALKKRQEAVLKNMDRVIEACKTPDHVSIEESFARYESGLVNSYDEVDINCNVVLAAAIWILDDLSRTGNLKYLYQYLPKDPSLLDMVELPYDFHHPRYEDELLSSVMYLILSRHGKLSILEDGPLDPNYNAMIELLDKEKVHAACTMFEEKQWEVLYKALKNEGYFDRKRVRIARQVEGYKRQIESQPSASHTQLPVLGIPKREERTIYDQLMELGKEWDEAGQKQYETAMNFAAYMEKTEEELKDLCISLRAAQELPGMELEDPYAACFAAIYLLDNDGDMSWLLMSGAATLEFAGRKLPWFREYDEDEEYVPVSEKVGSLGYDSEDNIDYYKKQYNGKNLAQLIFEISGCILPTRQHPLKNKKEYLLKEGVDEHTADVAVACAEAMYLSEYPSQALNLQVVEEDDGSFEELDIENKIKANLNPEKDASEPKDEESTENLIAEIERLKVELTAAKSQAKEMKRALAEVRRDAENEHKKAEHELKQLRMEHRELADLRELVFNKENGSTGNITKEDEKIIYPYETKKRTVIFGGHDTFLKAIKPLLPNVKFVEPNSMNFSPELVRNADVVWIQNNCISHPQYWNVLKYSRQAGVQVRYFAHASAEKCAEQLARGDMG